MPDNNQPEIQSPSVPEVEQPEIPEFEQVTEHPEGDNTRVQSEEIRYPNADGLYP
ncbi:hypothetical protein [Paenibacillus alkalitolerans]|uniref:hypothetical protein n=1 Tax=Paenibacillus alkalitolerans TaxID=2799335 RepID=UPI0018F2C856|nr:hypothetical protein [Paenibacillus alkalitolerans]